MNKALLLLLAFGFSTAQAQTLSGVKTFRNKEAKVKASNLYDVQLHQGNIEVTAAIKRGSAERLVFNEELVLKQRIDTTFDFETEDQKKMREWKKQFFSAPSAPFSETSDVIKSDVLEVTGSDLASKVSGTNLIQKGKVGMKTGGGFVLQKGDIVFRTRTVNYGEDDMRGNTTTTGTFFVSREELKLKSDEGKNLLYEFHSSKAEDIEVEFKESRSSNRGFTKESSSARMQKLISEDADLLLIGKRKPIVKFGKAPSDEDLLPVYYVFKVSPKTMDVVQQNKFSEPLARTVIFRESMPLNGGVLLVSAPTDITGDKSPNDTNPRNYVFRLIGDDTQVKYEFTHEVPAGWTFINNAFEMPDKSMVLIAAVNQKKKDKYINQIVYPINTDAFYFMTIKDGKVVQSELIQEENFNASFILPAGEKAGKKLYDPAVELTEKVGSEKLADGGVLAVWRTLVPVNGIPAYFGDVALQYSAEGKLVARYWIEAKSGIVPGMPTALIKKNDHEFYILTHTAVEGGVLSGSFLTKIDTGAKSMGSRSVIGDEKHVLSTKIPYLQASQEEIQFFGFDKGGKEFWTQKVKLN